MADNTNVRTQADTPDSNVPLPPWAVDFASKLPQFDGPINAADRPSPIIGADQPSPINGSDQVSPLPSWQNQKFTPAEMDQFGQLTLHEHLPEGRPDDKAPSVVVVDVENHRTHVLQWHNNEVEDVLSVPNAVGTDDAPTPIMRTSVSSKRLDPVWTPPVSIDPLQQQIGPYSQTHDNPLGVAYITLNTGMGSYGLHGTNRPDSIGKDVSHGCIRHQNEDILQVYNLVNRGTPVYLASHIEGLKVTPKDFQLAQEARSKPAFIGMS